VEVRWTHDRAQHITTRTDRYPDASNIEVRWASEAAADPRMHVDDPDSKSATAAVRIVGYSPTAGFIITVIAAHVDGALWGVTAWKTTGSERRAYLERLT